MRWRAPSNIAAVGATLVVALLARPAAHERIGKINVCREQGDRKGPPNAAQPALRRSGTGTSFAITCFEYLNVLKKDGLQKNKAGPTPCFRFFKFYTGSPPIVLFWSGCDWSRRRFFLPQTWTTPARRTTMSRYGHVVGRIIASR